MTSDKKPRSFFRFIFDSFPSVFIFSSISMLFFYVMELVDTKLVLPKNFYAFGFPINLFVTELIIVGGFIKKSKYRKSDPYRFSRVQYRILLVNSSIKIIDILKSNNYIITKEETSESTRHIEAIRNIPKNLESFKDKKHPITIKIEIISTKIDTESFRIEIFGKPYSPIITADFRNTVYDSLEELKKIFEKT